MSTALPYLLLAVGLGQLSVLIASALVPVRLKWKSEFAKLSTLHRQMYWVYGGYVVLSIVGLGTITAVNSAELAAGGLLARSFCLFAAAFWGIRLCLQAVLEVRDHLTTWWLRVGYYGLTFLFAAFTGVLLIAALH